MISLLVQANPIDLLETVDYDWSIRFLRIKFLTCCYINRAL